MDFDVTFCNKCQREEVKVCRHCSQRERDALRIADLSDRLKKAEEVIQKVDAHTREHAGVAGNGDLYAIVKAYRDEKGKI